MAKWTLGQMGKTKPKQSQFKPNSNPIQTQYKANTNPLQSQYKPNSNPILPAICVAEQTQFRTNFGG